ncbi:MAG: SGNH/GDSL hydrolase family protein [Pseudooceanicola sp.]|nr:SGNH/GDSL hydrolase family protein [Pseudooceanicola sp.]
MAVLSACSPEPPQPAAPRLLALGDSVLAWHGTAGASVPDVVGRLTGRAVDNRAVSGARLSATSPKVAAKGGDIRAQYPGGAWDWVILNGGANDLLAECGCRACDSTLDAMIGRDGRRGDIPALVDRIVADGAKVVVLGYYDANVKPNPFSRCSEEVDELDRRLEEMARVRKTVTFVDAAPAMNPRDPADWFVDRVHPSRQGAARIGERIAAAMQ